MTVEIIVALQPEDIGIDLVWASMEAGGRRKRFTTDGVDEIDGNLECDEITLPNRRGGH